MRHCWLLASLFVVGSFACGTDARSDGGIDASRDVTGDSVFDASMDVSEDVSGGMLEASVDGSSDGMFDASPDGSGSGDAGAGARIETRYFWDCRECPGGRELSPTGRVYRLNRWRYGGREYLFVSNYTSANLYDVTDPRNPRLTFAGGAYSPWGLIEGSPDDDTEQWDLALLPDDLAGVGMFKNFGWVTFRVVLDRRGMPSGFETVYRYRINPPMYIPTSRGARNAALFVAEDGRKYAAAAYLAQRMSTGGVDIADVTDPNNPRVVATLPNTTPNDLIRVVGTRNNAHLITESRLNNSLGGIQVFNVANPRSPVMVARIPLDVLDFDTSQNRLFVVHRNAGTSSVAAYDLSNPSSPRLLRSVTELSWQYNNVTGVGDYLVASSSANETGELPIRVYNVAGSDPPLTFPIEPLGGSWVQQSELDTVVYDAGDALVLYRAAWAVASATVIPKRCVAGGC